MANQVCGLRLGFSIMDRIKSSLSSIDFMEINGILWRFTFRFCGFPRFSKGDLIKYSSCDPQEAEALRFYDTRFHLFQVIYMLLQVTIAFKNLSFPVYTIFQIEKLNSLRDHFDRTRDGPLMSFNCLVTNCTHFRENTDIFQDLIRFPWYKLCHPKVALIQNPFLCLDLPGLVETSFQALLILSLSLMLPIELYFKKLNQEVITILFAPNIILKRNLNQIRHYLWGVINSAECFEANNQLRDYENSISSNWECNRLSDASFVPIKDYDSTWCTCHERISVDDMRKDVSLLDQKSLAFIADCLPITRRAKWNHTRSILAAIRTFGTWATLMVPVSSTIYAGKILMISRRATYDEIEQYTRSIGCKIWLRYNSDGAANELDFSSMTTDWSYLNLFEFYLMLAPCLLAASTSIISQLSYVEELEAAHTEQMDRAKFIQCLARILKEHLKTNMVPQTEKADKNTFCLDDNSTTRFIVQIHENNLENVLLLFPHLTPIKDADLDKFAIDFIMENGASLEAFINLLTKVYAGNRLLLNSINRCAPSLNVIVTYCYIIGYGAALTYIFWSRKLQQSDTFSGVLGVIGLVITNLIIAYISRVRSQNKQLIKVMWQVIAECEGFRDIRIRHMRSLWFKQVLVFLTDGNIVLKAFGIPVHHANVAELILWSSIAVIMFS